MRPLSLFSFLLFFLKAATSLAQAYNAVLVQDINSTYKQSSSEIAYLGDNIILSYDSGTGFEPHIIKKGSKEPKILKDIHPGPSSSRRTTSSSTRNFFKVNNLIFFEASSPDFGIELWRTDGTPEGTFLVKDLNPGTANSFPYEFTIFDNELAFRAQLSGTSTAGQTSLCLTNGTVTGTRCILKGDGVNVTNQTELTPVSNNIMILTARSNEYGLKPYIFNKNEFTLSRLHNLNLITAQSAPAQYLPLGDGRNVLATIVSPEFGAEPHIIDTISKEVRLLSDLNPGPAGSFTRLFKKLTNGSIIFTAYIQGEQIWRTRLTENSTVVVKSINNLAHSSSGRIEELELLNDKIFFIAEDLQAKRQLWVSDGTLEGTQQLTDFTRKLTSEKYPKNIETHGDYIFYEDEDAEGAPCLFFADSTSNKISNYKKVWNYLDNFIQIPITSNQKEIALLTSSSEGSKIERHNIQNMSPLEIISLVSLSTQDFNPKILGQLPNGEVVLTGKVEQFGLELFILDPQKNTINLLKDINPGQDNSEPQLVALSNNQILFSSITEQNGRELWITDGTESGTRLLIDIYPGTGSSSPGKGVQLGSLFLFPATHPDLGRELWATDGTTTGTFMLKDLNEGFLSSNPELAIEGLIDKGKLFFVANSAINGKELWVTDGSTLGTRIVSDINPGSGSSNPSHLTSYNRQIFFCATSESSGKELYVTSEDTLITSLVEDLKPGTQDGCISILGSLPGMLLIYGSRPDVGAELFKVSGVNNVVSLLKNFNSNSSDTRIAAYGKIENRLFLSLQKSGGQSELWITDGADSGTNLLTEQDIALTEAAMAKPLAANNLLFFSAITQTVGRELFISDGNKSGTILASDVAAGNAFSSPIPLIYTNNTLYFAADNLRTGVEVFRLVLNECPDDLRKTSPGDCGCGIQDKDLNKNNISDCLVSAELAYSLNKLRDKLSKIRIKKIQTPSAKKKLVKELASIKKLHDIFKNQAKEQSQLFGLTPARYKITLNKLEHAVKNLHKTRARKWLRNAIKITSRLKRALDLSALSSMIHTF